MLYDTLEYDPMAALGPLVPASPTASLGWPADKGDPDSPRDLLQSVKSKHTPG